MEEFLEFCEEETKGSEESEEESESEEEEEEEFLFPRNLDFTEVCSCHECCAKMNALKDFEKEFVSKLQLVEDCWAQLHISNQRCQGLANNIQVLAFLFELLHDNLKQVQKDLGLSSTIEVCDCNWVNQLKNVYMSMNFMLFGKNKFDLSFLGDKPFGDMGTYGEGGTEEEGVRAFRSDTIQKKIHRLLFLYRGTRVMDETHELLNKILDIENQHEQDRNFTKELDPSTSMTYIENQIELLKNLSFLEVEREMKEVLDKMSPFKENVDMLDVVRNGVSNTRRQMFLTSCKFLGKKNKINCNVKGHDLSGLEITLDSLNNQMKLFNDLWKKDYVPSIAHIISLCQQAEAEGFCPQGLCSPCCQYH